MIDQPHPDSRRPRSETWKDKKFVVENRDLVGAGKNDNHSDRSRKDEGFHRSIRRIEWPYHKK